MITTGADDIAGLECDLEGPLRHLYRVGLQDSDSLAVRSDNYVTLDNVLVQLVCSVDERDQSV